MISTIKGYTLIPLQAPLNQPFRIAVGQHNTLDNLLLTISLADGTKGFGEAAVATHITGETIEDSVKNLHATFQWLMGQDAADYLKISAGLHERLSNNKCALAAVEMALLDALTRQWKMPLWRFFGPKANALKTDITIVIGSLEETQQKAKAFYAQGFRSFKIKIGKDEELDFLRVKAVKKIAPKGIIILDANQGYSDEQTLKFLSRLKRAGVTVALIEQPVPKADWEGLKRVTKVSKVAVCADESVSSLAQAVRAIKEKAVDVINIKMMKTGIIESREIAQLARANGIGLMMGGMMESNVAMTAAAHMASGLGGFDFIDLDTPFFIKNHAERNPFLSPAGVYNFKNARSGIGL
jgi:L-alanine-DL-glutamate epimerase-like enolase superfamily enzyme